MAVFVVSNPPISPAIISASHPVIIELSSDKYGDPGITQFRYVAEVTALLDLGSKFTVVKGLPSVGIFDLANMFRELLFISEWQWNQIGNIYITQNTSPIQAAVYIWWSYNVQIKEQYYDAGVFTENSGALLNFTAGRGFSDVTDFIWTYANWWQFNGDYNFIPYSGNMPIVYAQRLEDPAWLPESTHPYMWIRMTRLNDLVVIGSWTFDRRSLGNQGVTNIPLYIAGQTDGAAFTGVRIDIFVNTVNAPGGTIEESYQIQKNVDTCVDDEEVVMFQNRFYQWSFLSFTKKKKDTINVEPQQAEGVTGRFRYNVDSSDTVTLNTDWQPEKRNPMFRDLIQTEKAFLVNTDGTLEQVTVVPNSWRIQTSRNDGLIQYSIRLRKSVDNFKP